MERHHKKSSLPAWRLWILNYSIIQFLSWKSPQIVCIIDTMHQLRLSELKSIFLKMHLSALLVILISVPTLSVTLSDKFTVTKATGLAIEYSSIAYFHGLAKIRCISECSLNPCCISVIWNQQDCTLYDVQFITEFLKHKEDSVYYARKQSKSTIMFEYI